MCSHPRPASSSLCYPSSLLATCCLLLSNAAVATERLPDYEERALGPPIAMVGVDGGSYTQSEFQPTLLDKVHWIRRGKFEVSSFWIGKYEVTFDQYKTWVCDDPDAAAPAEMPGLARARESVRLADELLLKGDMARPAWTAPSGVYRKTGSHPVVGMKQWAAKRYCHWLSMATGRFYRLPTEAEWEYACLAGGKSVSAYPWGWSEEDIEIYAVTSIRKPVTIPADVGSRKPNAWGIYDMIGNAEEWVADGYSPDGIRPYSSRKDPMVWPATRHLSQSPEKTWAEFKARGHTYCEGWGVAKGGSYCPSRSQSPESFTVAARTDPERFWRRWDDPHPVTLQDVFGNELEGSMSESIGFRVARPAIVPDKKIQLWHWGIYFDHDKWARFTIEPTQESPDKRD